ncbi:stage II sporulation protein D [Bacillus ectoiniformans]|uniref:stage II sporulation protein D n=1 Tax=Bacillus ectoiniformans TaxID=1494429 RepID=UPI003B82D34B|nr:stage II sporulation protein D [Bacillus ectoiniformans]
MKKFNPLWIGLSFLTLIAVIIPALLVIPFGSSHEETLLEENIQPKQNEGSLDESPVDVAVFRSQKKQVETFPLEQYVAGVVSAEMPAEFEKEALKAQALTARTYIVKHMMSGSMVNDGKANVTDTVTHQVFKSKEELQDIWGKDYEWKSKKIEEAVKETAGKILTYNQQPITASFFSTSNGYTENSEDYWSESLPYLKSVNSKWDEASPKYEAKKTMSVKEFENRLGISLKSSKEVGSILERTSGNRIAKLKIGGKEFSGREIREKLELPSSDFSWVRKQEEMIITTKGYGHGVGMSQYGANFMAKEGKDHQEIVKHYYQEVAIDQADRYLNVATAKK